MRQEKKKRFHPSFISFETLVINICTKQLNFKGRARETTHTHKKKKQEESYCTLFF